MKNLNKIKTYAEQLKNKNLIIKFGGMVNKRIKKNMLDTIIYTAELWWFIIMTIIFSIYTLII